MKTLEQELEELRNKEKELLQKIKISKTHSIPENIRNAATFLHETLCKHNHMDECGWYYDRGNWSEYSRKEYIDKAKKILKIVDYNTLEKVIEALK